jgi:hypothetical protein
MELGPSPHRQAVRQPGSQTSGDGVLWKASFMRAKEYDLLTDVTAHLTGDGLL